MDPQAPPPWLVFVLMFGLVSVALAVMALLAALTRGMQRLKSDPPDVRSTVQKIGVRSRALRSRLMTSVRARSPQPNEESPARSAVQPFMDRSKPNVLTPPDLPINLDELQRLAHTIALYAKRPNKELAILEAWGETKGEGEGYQRASRLFDAAMSDAARQAAKARPAAQLREVEAA